MCSKATQDFLVKLETAFEDSDENKDGFLRPFEMKIMMNKLGAKVDDKFIINLCMELDTDQDQLVSFQEMKTALLKKDPKEIQRAELENTFKKMDKDGSGRLSREEVKQQCIAMGIKMSDEGLENLIKKADKNNDGSIDINEFMLAWQGS